MREPVTRRMIGPQLSADSRVLNLGGQLREFSKLVGRRMGYIHKSVTIKLFSTVVYDTPVDTGLARGSWIPSVGGPAVGDFQRVDPSGSSVIAKINSTVTEDWTQVAFLMNYIEYIVPLEYGWSSRKSPEGMVRINVVRFQRMVSEAVAQAKKVHS